MGISIILMSILYPCQSVNLFSLTNTNGLVAKVTNYGVIITDLRVPDRRSKLDDIVLEFDTLEAFDTLRPEGAEILKTSQS